MTRTFEQRQATRERVPLLIGIDGPSGSGKTFSALRLATGMQRITGGDIYMIDTEARRSLHYAEQFKFRHVEFRAPFSPLDYLAAIEFCVKQAAGVVIVDSMSHEHEGPGGVLEWHEKEMAGDFKKQFLAWAKPKAARRRLINTILQLGVNAIFCFRAKEKLKLVTGKDPQELGWMPIAGEEFVYEMTTNILLYPGSGGVPTWKPTLPGERAMTKLPIQFAGIFEKPQPLSEEIGQALAQWAAGDLKPPTVEQMRAAIVELEACTTREQIDERARTMRTQAWTPEQRAEIKKAIDAQAAALKKLTAPSSPAESPSGVITGTSQTPDGAVSGAAATDGTASPAAAPVFSPWVGSDPRCVECSRLRTRIAQVGHDDNCSLGAER